LAITSDHPKMLPPRLRPLQKINQTEKARYDTSSTDSSICRREAPKLSRTLERVLARELLLYYCH